MPLLAVILYVTNFAWIALNNVIAASACARVFGGAEAEKAWALGLGLVSAAVVAAGPRAVGLADRAAVPLMAVLAVLMTVRFLSLPPEIPAAPATGEMSWLRGLDVVVGYQVSWILMFADYSRYSRSPGGAAVAVFLGLLARFFLDRTAVDVRLLYARGAHAATADFSLPALAAWAMGAGTYYASARWGGTLPSLAVTIVVYRLLSSAGPRPGAAPAR